MTKFLWTYLVSECFSSSLVMSVVSVLELALIKQWNPLQTALGGQSTVCGLSYLPLAYAFLWLEINWVNYQVREEKKTCPKSGKEWLSWVIKDLGLNTVLVTCEEGASDVKRTGEKKKEQVITGVPWALSEHRRDLPSCARFAWTGVSCFLLSASTYLPLSFDLHFRRWHMGYSWPVSDHDMTCNLSFIANTQKLSADWQSSHCLLNLSACVILSNAFAPKKSPLSDSHCSLCCYFSPGVRGEGKKENCFSRHQWVQQPLSHNSLLWTPVEFQRLRRILQMTWIDFSLKRSSTL